MTTDAGDSRFATVVGTAEVFRLYEQAGRDGYPAEWHREVLVGARRFQGIKDAVRSAAGHRCVRCGHPYRKGEHGKGEWTPCDDVCFRSDAHPFGEPFTRTRREYDGESGEGIEIVEAAWRILTVHHLNGDKLDCRWWNLASLCQRCHLMIQGRVVMARVWPWEHTDWFKPYVAGYYASVYLGEELTREQVTERLDELLALERAGGTTSTAERSSPDPAFLRGPP